MVLVCERSSTRLTVAIGTIVVLSTLLTQSLYPQAAAKLPEVAFERRLADAIGARVGDTILAGTSADSIETRVVVSAISEPAADPATITRREFPARFHLPDPAAMPGYQGRVDRFGVALGPGGPPGPGGVGAAGTTADGVVRCKSRA